MPIPTPHKGEKESEFVSRCMGDDVMNKDYPDQKQRAAICYSQSRKREHKESANMAILAAVTFDFNED